MVSHLIVTTEYVDDWSCGEMHWLPLGIISMLPGQTFPFQRLSFHSFTCTTSIEVVYTSKRMKR